MRSQKKRHNKRNTPIKLGKTSRPVAYCAYHRRLMSANQIKAKRCREKQCNALKPHYDPFLPENMPKDARPPCAETQLPSAMPVTAEAMNGDAPEKQKGIRENAGTGSDKEESEMKHYRICVQRCGYAVVEGESPDDALANARKLDRNAFNWEPVSEDMIEATAEVIGECGPDGPSID